MTVEIFETTVTPVKDGTRVHIHISDAPPDADDAAIRIVLSAKVPAYETPTVSQLQREAMKVAIDAMSERLQNLAQAIQLSNRHLAPKKLDQS